MQAIEEHRRKGLDYLEAVTTLLHRVRSLHPTAGLLEAADLQWWWRSPRTTDELPQLFWFDGAGQPVAAVIATDWGDGVALDPILLPGASPDWVVTVIERGLSHVRELGLRTVDVVVDQADTVMREVLARHGFAAPAGADLGMSVVDAWLATQARPAVSPLHPGYRLCSRLDMTDRPHHMASRNGAQVEARLRQTSLYRPELDLLLLDENGQPAAYTLFWLDPDTGTGLVEPMRTEDAHQRRGLARHLLTAGIERLAQAGAQRIKLCFRPDNAAAKSLYLSVGFVPGKQTVVLARGADVPPA